MRYVDEMFEKRGYVLGNHKVIIAGYDVLQAVNGTVGATYLKQLRLGRKIKELIFIVRFTSMRANRGHIHNHIHVALDLSVPKEKYWMLKISFTEAGIVAFREGLEA